MAKQGGLRDRRERRGTGNRGQRTLESVGVGRKGERENLRKGLAGLRPQGTVSDKAVPLSEPGKRLRIINN